MNKTLYRSIFGIDSKSAFGNVILVANPLVWYSAVIIYLQSILTQMSSTGTITFNDSILVWGIHFSGIVFSAIFGPFLTKRVQRDRFLIAWMILGAISSLAIFAIGTWSLPITALIVLLLGISLGIGMPTCMSYYTERIPIENRGRTSGVVMLIAGIVVFALTAFPVKAPITLGLILACWRLSSLLVFYLLKTRTRIAIEKDATSYKQLLSQRSLMFYLIPWIMFSLVNYIAGPVQVEIVGEKIAITISIIQNVMMGVFAVIGGFLLDKIGRKRVAIFGFVMLGVDTATLGLFPQNIWSNYFSATLDGIAFGFLWVIFIVTIWGDLSQNKDSSKYYAIGVLPFFISKFLEITVGNNLSHFILTNAGPNGLFSFIAFFLFLAVLPLFYAPETLPEKVMKDRDLKSYIEKAKKKAQKGNENTKKNEETSNRENKEKDSLEFDEYEKAKKLAEKYY